MTPQYKISVVPTAQSYLPGKGYIPVTPKTPTWTQLVTFLRKCKATQSEKDGVAIVPANIIPTVHPKAGKAGRWRLKQGVKSLSILPLDLDAVCIGGDDPYTVAEWLSERIPGYQAVLYTSWNHGVEHDSSGEMKWQPGHPRVRALVPLSHPVPVQLWPHLTRWAQMQFTGIDSCISNPACLYYTPRKDNPRAVLPGWVHEIPGCPLDLEALPTGDGETSLHELYECERAEKRARDRAAQERREALSRGDLVLDASRQRRYALAALRGSCADICGASPGDRHATLARVSWRMGGMILEGVLSWDETCTRLHDAACDVLPRERHADALRTITGQVNEGASRAPFDWTRVASVSSTYDYLSNSNDGPVTFAKGGVQ